MLNWILLPFASKIQTLSKRPAGKKKEKLLSPELLDKSTTPLQKEMDFSGVVANNVKMEEIKRKEYSCSKKADKSKMITRN